MQIAVFEWISCGGMHATAIDQIPHSLLREGGQMLSCIASQLHHAGAAVHTIIEPRLLTPELVMTLEGVNAGQFQPSAIEGITAIESTLAPWLQLAEQVDVSLIIAPEIDGILQRVIGEFSRRGHILLNCQGTFLDHASDKWLTSRKLSQFGVPHPPTCLASDFLSPASMSDFSSPTAAIEQRYVLKSRFGAGCNQLLIGLEDMLKEYIAGLSEPESWILQPWVEGEAYSCSGLACPGQPLRWLPLTTQTLERNKLESGLSTLEYHGGRIVRGTPQAPTQLLNDTLRALGENPNELVGWVGIDLLLQPAGQWLTIEVNPRLTSNLMAHCQSHHQVASNLYHIAAQLVRTPPLIRRSN